jgi:peptide/nickel transport system substrate-binding protein
MIKFARTCVTAGALALVGATALAACGSSSPSTTATKGLAPNGSFGKVPAQATGAEHGGTVTVAAPPGTAANWILPLINAANNSVFNVLDFGYQMYRPLYWSTNGYTPEFVPDMSLADQPAASNGDKTFTITLKTNYKWSDGTPITSTDILFWFDELKAALKISPANWADYTPDVGIPDEVSSVTAPNATTVVFNMKTAVNPTWFWLDELGAIQPWPAQTWQKLALGNSATSTSFETPANATKIYNYLYAASQKESTFATNPLWQTVDGPYKLTSFTPTNGAFTMVPNKAYGGPESKAPPTIQLDPFTSDTAELNAVKAKSVDVGYVPSTDLPQMPSIETSYNDFGFPTFGWTYAAYNFKDQTNHFAQIIGQLYIRKVLAELENEQGYIDAFLKGAGGVAYGPVPTLPVSSYTPSDALTDPYPYNPNAAMSQLTAHGWKVVAGGTDTCAKAGTAANECGAGIPAGTALSFPVIYGTSPASIGQEIQAWASEASKIGVHMTLKSSNFSFITQNDNDVAVPKDDNSWAVEDFGGFTDGTYPTTFGVFNSTGSANLGGYSNPEADSLITASVSSSNPDAVKAEASYLTLQQPGLFQPNPDAGGNGSCVIVWTKSLSGTPASFANLTQFDMTPEFWFFTK